MAGESIGWGGQFWLHNGTALAQMLTVTEVDFPEDTIDEHEITPLNASGKRKQYIGGLIDGGEFTVTGNYVAGGADDVLARAAFGLSRAFKIVIPDDTGAAERMITGTVLVKGYKPSAMKPNEPMMWTLTLRATGAQTEAAAA